MIKKKYYIYKMNVNVLNFCSIILLLIFMGIGFVIYPSFLSDVLDKYSFLFFMMIYFLYMVLHEILHSIAYVIYGARFKNITYGMCLEKGVLCCLCKQNINKNNILHSLMYPLFFIGFLSFIIGYLFKFPLLFLLSIFNISGCIGDILMFLFIYKLGNDIEFSEFDDPLCFGIYSNHDISNNKYFGLDYVGESNSLIRNDYRKVYISFYSLLFLILIIVLGLIIKFI